MSATRDVQRATARQVLAEITLDTLASLELPESLQRRASQPLGITRDGTLPLPLDAGYSAIECSDKLSQLADEVLV